MIKTTSGICERQVIKTDTIKIVIRKKLKTLNIWSDTIKPKKRENGNDNSSKKKGNKTTDQLLEMEEMRKR